MKLFIAQWPALHMSANSQTRLSNPNLFDLFLPDLDSIVFLKLRAPELFDLRGSLWGEIELIIVRL